MVTHISRKPFFKRQTYWLGLAAAALLTVGLPATAAKIIELDAIAAVINSEVITTSELDKRIEQIKAQLRDKAATLPPDTVLRRQILERMIIEQLQLQLAKQSGIRVDDEQLNQVINNIAKDNGLSLVQFRDVLSKEGVAFADFREQIRNELIATQLRRNRVESAIAVSEQEVDNQLERSGDKTEFEYHVGHILIALPEAASPDTVDAAQRKAEQILTKLKAGADFTQTAISSSDAQHALQGGDLGWMKAGQLPSVFADAITNLKPGQLTEVLRNSSGFHIAKLNDKRRYAAKHIIEQTLARHILIKTDQITTNAVAYERLQRVRRRILDGEDFAQLARAISSDTVSGNDGGNLGWLSPGMLVPEFEQVMNKTKPGEISEPFQTRYGWHIVQILSRRQHDDTVQYQRNQARQLILQRKVNEETELWLRRLRAEAYVDIRLGE